MTTYNPQTDAVSPAVLNVDLSAYKTTLETVAPGVTALIAQTQVVGEPWHTTLQRLVTTLEATPEQRQILMTQAERASENLPPAPIPGAESQGIPTLWKVAGGLFATWLFFLR